MLDTVEPDSGEVFKAKNLRLGYLPQELLTLSGRTVLELAMETGDRPAPGGGRAGRSSPAA